MEYFTKLKTDGWKPVYSEEMYAISQLRKLVYFLSTSISMEALGTVLFNLKIGYVDVKGNTQKEKVIFILNYCQTNNLLQDFYDMVASLNLLPHKYVDTNVLSKIPEANLKYLSFDIPEFASCQWKRTVSGEKETLNCHEYQENVTMRRNKQNPCEKVYRCDICGKIIHRETEHDWSEWKYISANSCDQERVCKRCGKKETSHAQHDWSKYYKTPNGSLYRICQHCHLREYDIKGKWRGYVHWDNGTMDLWEIAFYEETSMFIFTKHRATIEVYINVNMEKNVCEGIVREKGKVEIYNKKITITGKKLLAGTNYNLDDLDGIISDDCLTIEGIVSSKKDRGEIKLEQVHED